MNGRRSVQRERAHNLTVMIFGGPAVCIWSRIIGWQKSVAIVRCQCPPQNLCQEAIKSSGWLLPGRATCPLQVGPSGDLTTSPDTPEVARTEERQTERAVSPENGLLGVLFWRSDNEPGLTNRPCGCLFTFSVRLRFLWRRTQDVAACTFVLFMF